MTYANIKNYRERGFTIVELLIVIIVIGILATLVLIAYNNVQGQARDTKRQSDATSLKDAAETYKSQSTTGYYPRVTPTGVNTAGPLFQSDISTAGNYTNGTTAVSVDTTVTNEINPAATIAASVPATGNPNYIEAKYCPAGTDQTTATGMAFWYWSESKKAIQPSNTVGLVTGVGCGSVTP